MLLWGARLMSWELPGCSWSGSSDSSVLIEVLFNCLGSELCCDETDIENSVTLVERVPLLATPIHHHSFFVNIVASDPG